ncbi:hypothetical protein E3A20_02490 [Planctomyces bekefii]|uniref:Uncharacterized protein n=1 Tax=Planctomyces bekefii TaxID=1653850 RepID=A0A5C6MDL5_9PLAN|nr:hypothetical protein E3A20_02490 [Planctomyces bekefii]
MNENPSTMRAITMNAFGKKRRLFLVDVANPTVGPDDVLIQVEAASPQCLN